MGFCLSCGDLANTPRCPRCKGKVSGASALGLSSRDAWSATYLAKENKKVHSPNLEKLNKEKSFDTVLSNSDESISSSSLQSDSKSSTPVSNLSPVEIESCEKCSKELRKDQESLIFQTKKYHKRCLPCSICSSTLDKVFESEGRACCKACTESLVASSHSSPTLKTPENESLDSFVNLPDTPVIQVPEVKPSPINISSKTLNKTKLEPDSNVALLSKKLTNLKVGGRLTGTQELPAQPSLVYSRSFQQLQATVNNKLAPTPSVRNRPRKVSETSNGLSFADLLANRRVQDPKTNTVSRRPVSILGVESINKRSSMLTPSVPPPKDSTASSNSHIRSNRLSLSRPRPTSLYVGDKNAKFNLNPDKPSLSQEKPKENNYTSQLSSINETTPSVDNSSLPPLPTFDEKEETESLTNSEPVDKDSSSSDNSDDNVSNNSSKLNCSQCHEAIGLTWFKLPDGRLLHKGCFKCHHCQKAIDDGKYSIYKDNEYHTQCLQELSNKPAHDPNGVIEDICDRCRKVIIGSCFTLSNGNQYHPDCFTCAGCKKKFEQGTYINHENKEYHKECVPRQAKVSCAKCSNPIQGVFVTNNNLNYHSECFRCNDCNKIITPKTPFGEINQQHYCEPCLVKQYTTGSSSFAVSAAQKEQRRSAFTPFRS